MKLLFKQKFFSWFDSYDITDENGNIVYKIKGQLSWGHCLKIYNSAGNEVGMVKEKIISLLPKFFIYENGNQIGYVSKRLSLFKPVYDIDFKGWSVSGNIFEWNYCINALGGRTVAEISKKLFNFTDTYEIDVLDPADALYAVMFVVAVDAEKCSRNN